MQPHQQRVVDEKKDLDEKISKLRDFQNASPIWKKLPLEQKTLLRSQLGYMVNYSVVLNERINLFS